jgi:hypothetical protein
MKAPPSAGVRDNRGMVAAAVLLFSVVAVMILLANFNLNYAVGVSGDAFDSFNSQTVEKNGVAQLVKESILAVRETAPTNSASTISTEIQNRLTGMFPAGQPISVTLDTAPAVPANPFFPFGVPATAVQPAYFSSSPRGIAGMGNLFTSLAVQGPTTDLGRLTYSFTRASTAAPNENWTYVVNADLFAVPLTNVDVVAYGLPATGMIPTSAPSIPVGTFGTGVSTLIVTSNDPGNDPTAYPDLYAGVMPEKLPYQFRNAVSFSWNAYEFLWSTTYQNALVSLAQAEADPGNTAPTVLNPTPPTGAVYDFASGNNPTIAGVAEAGNAISIDCGAVQSQVLAVVDAEGVGSVTITGSAGSGPPFILLIRNTAGNLGKTSVTFTGSNNRPVIFYLENSNVAFTGAPQIEGALFLDPATVAAGTVTWFGHFSFYGPASPLGSLHIGINDSAPVKAALSGLAPRVLLVSTTATRQ